MYVNGSVQTVLVVVSLFSLMLVGLRETEEFHKEKRLVTLGCMIPVQLSNTGQKGNGRGVLENRNGKEINMKR